MSAGLEVDDPPEFDPYAEDCATCGGSGELTACPPHSTPGCSHINDITGPCPDCWGEGTVRSWMAPVDGAGIWTATAPHRELRLTLLGTIVVCTLLAVAFLGLVKAGRALMCETHDQALVYCDGFVPVATR